MKIGLVASMDNSVYAEYKWLRCHAKTLIRGRVRDNFDNFLHRGPFF